jgi:hypothetical protein
VTGTVRRPPAQEADQRDRERERERERGSPPGIEQLTWVLVLYLAGVLVGLLLARLI